MDHSKKKESTIAMSTKSAFKVFGSVAVAIYLSTVYYCYVTGHFVEMAVMGGVTAGVTALILIDFFSIGSKNKNDSNDKNKDDSKNLPSVQRTEIVVQKTEILVKEPELVMED